MNKKSWWQTEDYSRDEAIPEVFRDFAGPNGVALVKAWSDGRTQSGWGLQPPGDSTEGFMPRYQRGEFLEKKATFGYEKDRWAFAFVMRSVQLVCIDIDGKNGGLEHAKRLGSLPYTLAETSKSGSGYHLFYSVSDEWDEDKGFARLNDRIGIEQGVDVRATGCVYHYKQQRWNDRPVAPLPQHLYQLLTRRDQKIAATSARINGILATQDELEILMLHEELLTRLEQPIPEGKRNNTLFALGSQMQEARVPGWDRALHERAIEVGLDQAEADKLLSNIQRYSA